MTYTNAHFLSILIKTCVEFLTPSNQVIPWKHFDNLHKLYLLAKGEKWYVPKLHAFKCLEFTVTCHAIVLVIHEMWTERPF